MCLFAPAFFLFFDVLPDTISSSIHIPSPITAVAAVAAFVPFYCDLFCLREKSAAAVSSLQLTPVTSASDWIIGDIDVATEQINNHRQ